MQCYTSLKQLDGYEENVQVMSTVNGWLNFRRYFLAKYPKSEEFFLSEAKKYFPNLRIHYTTKDKIGPVLHTHAHKIISYLTILNDYLISDFLAIGNNDINSFLPWFKSTYNLDDASLEGKKDRNKFEFTFDDGVKAYCEPHLKIYKDDAGNQNQHCRIYFKKPQDNEKTVYVGCICHHL